MNEREDREGSLQVRSFWEALCIPLCLGRAVEFQSKSKFSPTSEEFQLGFISTVCSWDPLFRQDQGVHFITVKIQIPFFIPAASHALCLGCHLPVTAELIWWFRIVTA